MNVCNRVGGRSFFLTDVVFVYYNNQLVTFTKSNLFTLTLSNLSTFKT